MTDEKNTLPATTEAPSTAPAIAPSTTEEVSFKEGDNSTGRCTPEEQLVVVNYAQRLYCIGLPITTISRITGWSRTQLAKKKTDGNWKEKRELFQAKLRDHFDAVIIKQKNRMISQLSELLELLRGQIQIDDLTSAQALKYFIEGSKALNSIMGGDVINVNMGGSIKTEEDYREFWGLKKDKPEE